MTETVWVLNDGNLLPLDFGEKWEMLLCIVSRPGLKSGQAKPQQGNNKAFYDVCL